MFATFASYALLAFGVVHAQNMRNITVDDTDASITYKGSWNKSTGLIDAYNETLQSASEAGASATFTFTGVAVYYFAPLFENITGGVSTLLTLDSGTPQLVNLTRVGNASTRSAVRWSASNLSNGKHTLVNSPGRSGGGEVAGWGQVDGFIYTMSDSKAQNITITCDDPRIIYSPPGVWTTDNTNLPACAISKSGVRTTSTPNATFVYDFNGDYAVVRTINSPKGGKISLSVNGGPPQIYDTYSNSTGCGSSQIQRVSATGLRRRSQAYNTLTVKTVDGETRVDGITDGQNRPSAAHRTIPMDWKFCVGAIFISYLTFSGVLPVI